MTTYKGWEVEVLLGQTTPTTLGLAQSMTVDITANIDPVHGVGHIDPVELKQGPREITGSLERMYGDDRLWNAIDPTGTEQSYFILKGQISSGDADERIIQLDGVKFDSFSLDLPQDDFVSESVDFTATEITLSGSAATSVLGVGGASTQPATTSVTSKSKSPSSKKSKDNEIDTKKKGDED